MSLKKTCSELRQVLEKAVVRNLASSILLSGGLDTSILASIAARYVSLRAFTVAFDEAEAPDLRYAEQVAEHLRLEHRTCYFSRTEIFQAIPQVVKVMHTFDPMQIRNDLAIFIALKHLKANDVTATMTGDGGDELFAGYGFLFGYSSERLRSELDRMQRFMRFSSVTLGKALGVEAKLPFLDSEVKASAMKLSPSFLVRSVNGRRIGKWILRKTFEEVLPKEVAWREKIPIESGTGTTVLPKILDKEISDAEFTRKKKKYLDEDKVAIRDKEQLFYYEIYRTIFGIPHAENTNAKTCPMCNSNTDQEASHCRTCGAYPI